MFTLKIMSYDDLPGSVDHSVCMWFPGVTVVSLIGTKPKSEWSTYLDSDSASDYTIVPPTGPVSMLYVKLTDGSDCYLMVERAWLLGPDGQTVDRIAP